MGLAACRAAEASTLADRYFSGKEHHTQFLENSFLGATGNVRFPKDSFSRDGYSVYYFVSEIHEIDQPEDAPGESVYSGTSKMYFDVNDRHWKQTEGASAYIYSDGTTSPPPELSPAAHNTHTLTLPVQVVCWFLAVAVIITSIGLCVFVFVHKKNQVITASQPPFLYIICTGTLVLSSSIVPLAMDDAKVSVHGCSIACMSQIWLMSIGFTITFSALFSKTWRINKLVRKARGFKRVQLSAADVIIPFLILFGTNVLILTVWTIMAPLEWVRTISHTDAFGRPAESLGRCMNPKYFPYAITLFLVNGVALLLAIAEAYKARHINTEFSESKYIGMAVVCIFQALFFGVPLFFIAQDWPTAQVFVVAAVIFIICMAVLLLIFVPKIILIQNKAVGDRPAPSSVSQHHRPSHRQSMAPPRNASSNAHWGIGTGRHSAPAGPGRGSSIFHNGSSTLGSFNRGTQSVAAVQANTLNISGMHQMPTAVEGVNINVYADPAVGGNAGSQPSSGTSSTMGLEEEVWNSTHLHGLNRLQNELSKACIQIQTLQQEIDALDWSSKVAVASSRTANTTWNNDHSMSIIMGGGDQSRIGALPPSAPSNVASNAAADYENSHNASAKRSGGGSNRSSVSFADGKVPAAITALHTVSVNDFDPDQIELADETRDISDAV
jgi:hypothetical protein